MHEAQSHNTEIELLIGFVCYIYAIMYLIGKIIEIPVSACYLRSIDTVCNACAIISVCDLDNGEVLKLISSQI